MKGLIRSTVLTFPPDADNIVTVELPFEQMHIFEAQIFFPAGCIYSFAGTTNGGVDGVFFDPTTSDVNGNRNPLILRNHPDFKRTDTLKFVLTKSTPNNNSIVVLVSYIDQ